MRNSLQRIPAMSKAGKLLAAALAVSTIIAFSALSGSPLSADESPSHAAAGLRAMDVNKGFAELVEAVKPAVGNILILTAFAPSKKATISADEIKLYKIIMQYRKSKRLPAIPLSNALTHVAQTHAKDLAQNNPDKKPRCNMHSWSVNDNWSGCCYTNDHAKASCMWDKPRDLTTYPGDGYEIAARSTILSPEEALQLWKKSTDHNNVIINKDIWKKMQWKSIGIGINGQYAVVWFGKEDDPEGPPSK